MNFEEKGQVFTDLQRYDLVVALELPQKWPVLKPFASGLQERYRELCWGYAAWGIEDFPNTLGPHAEPEDEPLPFVCRTLMHRFQYYSNKEEELINRINRKLDFDLFSVLPDLRGKNDVSEISNIEGRLEYPGWQSRKLRREVQTYTLDELKNTSLYQTFLEDRVDRVIWQAPDPPRRNKRDVSEHTFALNQIVETLKSVYPDIRLYLNDSKVIEEGSCLVWSKQPSRKEMTQVWKNCADQCAQHRAGLDWILYECFLTCHRDAVQTPDSTTRVPNLQLSVDEVRTTTSIGIEASTTVPSYQSVLLKDNNTFPSSPEICLTERELTRLVLDQKPVLRDNFKDPSQSRSVTDQKWRDLSEDLRIRLVKPRETEVLECVLHILNLTLTEATDMCVEDIKVNCMLTGLEVQLRGLKFGRNRTSKLNRELEQHKNNLTNCPEVTRQRLEAVKQRRMRQQDRSDQVSLRGPRIKRDLQSLAQVRDRRSPLLATAAFSLVRTGLGLIYDWRRNAKLNKALEKLEHYRGELDRVSKNQADLLATVKAQSKALQTIWTDYKTMNLKIQVLNETLTELSDEFRVTTKVIRNLVNGFSLLTWTIGMVDTELTRELEELERMDEALDRFLDAVDSLSSGTLTQTILPSSQLACYLRDIAQSLETDLPEYELAMTQVNQYYDVSFISFVAQDLTLYVHIPVYLKRVHSVPKALFRVKSVPVPVYGGDLKANSEGRWTGDFSQLQVESEYFALGQSSVVGFSDHDLQTCRKYGHTYYCQQLNSLESKDQSSCLESIYLLQLPNIKKFCRFQFLKDYTPSPQVMLDQENLALVGMPVPWTLLCDGQNEPLTTGPYVILPAKKLCHCELEAGGFALHKSLSVCTDSREKFQMKYVLNLATLLHFHPYLPKVEMFKFNSSFKVWDKFNATTLVVPGRLLDKPVYLDHLSCDELEAASSAEMTDELKFSRLIRDLQTGSCGRHAEHHKLKKSDKGIIQAAFEPSFWMGVSSLAMTGILVIIAVRQCRRNMILDHEIQDVRDRENILERRGLARHARFPHMIPLVLMSLCVPAEARDEKAETIFQISWSLNNLGYFSVNFLAALLALKVGDATINLIRRARHNYLNGFPTCKEILCKSFLDKCDIFLQMHFKGCHHSAKIYLATILGPPSNLSVAASTSIQSVKLRKGFFKDILVLDWCRTPVEYQDKPWELPRAIPILDPGTRWSVRHCMKILRKDVLRQWGTSLIVVYNNTLLIKSLKISPVYTQNGLTVTPQAKLEYDFMHDRIHYKPWISDPEEIENILAHQAKDISGAQYLTDHKPSHCMFSHDSRCNCPACILKKTTDPTQPTAPLLDTGASKHVLRK